jgi:hypothetical protein
VKNFFFSEFVSVKTKLRNGIFKSFVGFDLSLNFIVGNNVARLRKRSLENRFFNLFLNRFWWRGWRYFFFLFRFIFQFLHNFNESFLCKNSSFVLLLIHSMEVLNNLIETMDSEIILN